MRKILYVLYFLSGTAYAASFNKIIDRLRIAYSCHTKNLYVGREAHIAGNVIIDGTINGKSITQLGAHITTQPPISENMVARFADDTGNVLQGSPVEIDDTGNISGVNNVALTSISKEGVPGSEVLWPNTIGAVNTFLGSDGAGNLIWAVPTGSGNVSTALPFVNNDRLVITDTATSAMHVKESDISIDSFNNIADVNTITANNFVGTVTGNMIGNASSATTAENLSTPLSGEITSTSGGTNTRINNIGGFSRTIFMGLLNRLNNATASANATSLVMRNASGNFSANEITANTFQGGTFVGAIQGNARSADTFNNPLHGDVTGLQNDTVVVRVGGAAAADIASTTTLVQNATPTNTLGSIVRRDTTDGGFHAGTMHADLVGNVTGNVTGTATHANSATTALNFSGELEGEVTGTQDDTQVESIAGQNRIALATAAVAVAQATANATADTLVQRNALGNFSGHIIAADTFQGNLIGNATTATTATTALSAASLSTALAGEVTGSSSDTHINNIDTFNRADIIEHLQTVADATTNATADTLMYRDSTNAVAVGTLDVTTVNATTIDATTVNSDTFVGDLQGNATSSDTFNDPLSGDVTGLQNNTVVSRVGGVIAATIAAAATLTNNATATNTLGTLVRRNTSDGGFSAGTIQANLVGNVTGNVTGTATNAINATKAVNFTGPLIGEVTGTQDDTRVQNIGTATRAALESAAAAIALATASDTAGRLVLRDGSGDFSSHTITATNRFVGDLTGTATHATTAVAATTAISAASATTLSQPLALNGDVTGTHTATVVSNVGGQTAANIAAAAALALTATNNNMPNTIVRRDSNGNFSAHMITLTDTPVNSTDVVTKDYVDTVAAAGFKAQEPARVVSTTNIASLQGLPNVDGVTLIDNDRILLVSQSDEVENGLWIVHSGSWERPSDFDTNDIAGLAYVLILEGTSYTGSSWLASTPTAIIDTDEIIFSQFSLSDVTQGVNVGTGVGQIFRNKAGNILNFKTLSQSNHVVLTNNANDVNIATDATDSNISGTIVARNGSGNFSAGTITANLTGSASNNVLKAGDTMTGHLNMAAQSEIRLHDTTGGQYVGLRAPGSIATSYTLDWPTTAPAVGQFLQTLSTTELGWSTLGGNPTTTRTFYVSLSGNDTNEGTFGAPFRTLKKAIQSANSIASLFNPVAIYVGAGLFAEDNSGGPLTISAEGVSIIGSSRTSTIIAPTQPANNLMLSTVAYFEINDITFFGGSSGSTATAITVNTNSVGVSRLHNIVLFRFNKGVSCVSSNGVPILISENTQCSGNAIGIEATNMRIVIKDNIFLGPVIELLGAVNTGILATGSATLMTVVGTTMRFMQTAIEATGGAHVRLLNINIESSINGLLMDGGATGTITSCNFVSNVADSINIQATADDTALVVAGCQMQGHDTTNTPQGIAVKVSNGAHVSVVSSAIENMVLAIQCGDSDDDNTTILEASGVMIEDCVADIEQQGSSRLQFVAGSFDNEKVAIEDPANVIFAGFHTQETMSDETATFAVGNMADEQFTIYEVLNDTETPLPSVMYEPDYYTYKGVVYKNPNTGQPTLNGIESVDSDAAYYVITGDRTDKTSLHLISDAGNVGDPDNVRGWEITKEGTTAGLTFNYRNNDTSGQAQRDINPIMRLNGFDNQVEFPLATNGALPTNIVARLVWAADTNLYRASAGVLRTDGTIIIGGLTANRVLTTNRSNQLASTTITPTELNNLSGITGNVQTQLNSKLSKSGDTMTGDLQVPAGSTLIPSLRFSNSTNTGFSAPITNTVSISTNGFERMRVASNGTVSINQLAGSAGTVHNDASGNLSSSLIVNADVSATAAIADTKLATITTAGKVANSATTATTESAPHSIVLRNGLGNIQENIVGAASLNVLKSGDTMNGDLQLPAGSVDDPSLQFTGSVSTGLSAPISNTLSISTNELERMRIAANGTVSINQFTAAGVVHNDASGNLSSSLITNADVSATAAIADTKLATITTAGKVANSATSATTENIASTIALRDSFGNIGGNIIGSASLNVLKTGDVMTGALELPLGTASNPSLRFTGNVTTGLFVPSANSLALATDGVERVRITATGAVLMNQLAGSAGVVHNDASGTLSSSLIVNADISATAAIADTKLATIATAGKVANSATTATTANAADTIVLRNGSGNISGTLEGTVIGAASLNVLKSGDTMSGDLQLPAGTSDNPSLQFTGSISTGLSAPLANTLSISTNELERMRIAANGTVSINQFTAAGVVHNDASGNLSSSLITNADVSVTAAIVDTKLATITTAGKVANSATTATVSSTPNSIVLRNNSGNIQATLEGNVIGSASLNVLKTGDAMTGALELPLGTASNPSLRFTGNVTTGLFIPSANSLALATDGVERVRVTANGAVLMNQLAGSAGIVHNDASGTLSSSLIVNADISATAAIADTKLATIATAGKVANSATTATASNTNNTIVLRNSSGNFSAGTITASLTGTASLNVLKAGDSMTGSLELPVGNIDDPSLRFTGSTTTGLSAPLANTLSISTNGFERMRIGATGAVLINQLSGSSGIVHNDAAGNLSSSLITNADVSATAAIADTKLAAITTAGKVANSATTATTANTADTIVLRNGSGNISGTLEGAVVGSASLNVLKTGDIMTGALELPLGTASGPSLRFSGNVSTGLFIPAANSIAIVTNGAERLRVAANGAVSINQLSGSAGVVHNDASGILSSSLIVNADVSATAAIADTKLATISTSGKVANSATTATTANTVDTIVLRNGSGNISGTLEGTVVGSASLNVLKSGDIMTGDLELPTGNTDDPSLRFTGSATTGLSVPLANTLSISTNGFERLRVGATGTVSINQLSGSAGIVHNDTAGNISSSLIVNADISASAAIADTKLATISTSGKVANSATTAVATSTNNAIVLRDSSGNFSAGTITASLTGAASLNVLKAGDTMTGALQLLAGTAASPALKFTGSTTTGLSAPTANTLTISAAGTARVTVASSSTTISNTLIQASTLANQAIQVATPTTGSTVIVSAGTSILLLTPAGIVAGVTITFPPSPINGQIFTILLGATFQISFTSFVGGTGGATITNPLLLLTPIFSLTDATAGKTAISFIYIQSTNSWYRMHQ